MAARVTHAMAGDGGPSRHPSGDQHSVLVVDDEAETRDMLEMLLTHAGYLVYTAANGADALELLRSVRPGLIVLDLQMPVMDGYEFRQAQRRDLHLLQIPTIVLTGTDYEPMLDPAIAETLRKPVGGKRLLAAVKQCMMSRCR